MVSGGRQIKRVIGFLRCAQQTGAPFRFILAYALCAIGAANKLLITRRGYQLRLTNSSLAKQMFANPACRESEEDLLAKLLTPGSVYVDIGANIGSLALFAAKTLDCQVIAVEAHPETFHALLANISLNKPHDIQAMHYACGEESMVVHFTDMGSDDQNKVTDRGGVRVQCEPLDELLADDLRVQLLKIDVEGFELFVLRGAIRTLSRCDAVLFEAYDSAYAHFGYTLSDVVALLHQAGFAVWRLEGGAPTPLQGREGSPACENLLALPIGKTPLLT